MIDENYYIDETIPKKTRVGKFNPDSKYIKSAVEEYLTRGGKTTKYDYTAQRVDHKTFAWASCPDSLKGKL